MVFIASEHNHHHVALDVEYDGTPYIGWARQPGYRSVEGDLLSAFAKLECDVFWLRCAGRTDSGVHALSQVVDVAYCGDVPPSRLARALATCLPAELKARKATVAEPGFNARRDATSRSYKYRILTAPVLSPLRDRFVLHHPRPLDRKALDEAAAMMLGKHRFTAFTPSQTSHKFFDRTIAKSYWYEQDDELIYEVKANAFMRNMVRIMVGTMLEVARGQLSISQLEAALDGGPRSAAGATAAAKGLCLTGVTWEPQDDLPIPPNWRSGRKIGQK